MLTGFSVIVISVLATDPPDLPYENVSSVEEPVLLPTVTPLEFKLNANSFKFVASEASGNFDVKINLPAPLLRSSTTTTTSWAFPVPKSASLFMSLARFVRDAKPVAPWAGWPCPPSATLNVNVRAALKEPAVSTALIITVSSTAAADSNSIITKKHYYYPRLTTK